MLSYLLYFLYYAFLYFVIKVIHEKIKSDQEKYAYNSSLLIAYRQFILNCCSFKLQVTALACLNLLTKVCHIKINSLF